MINLLLVFNSFIFKKIGLLEKSKSGVALFSKQHVNILLKNIRQSLVSPAKSGVPQRTELYTSYRSIKAYYLGYYCNCTVQEQSSLVYHSHQIVESIGKKGLTNLQESSINAGLRASVNVMWF